MITWAFAAAILLIASLAAWSRKSGYLWMAGIFAIDFISTIAARTFLHWGPTTPWVFGIIDITMFCATFGMYVTHERYIRGIGVAMAFYGLMLLMHPQASEPPTYLYAMTLNFLKAGQLLTFICYIARDIYLRRSRGKVTDDPDDFVERRRTSRSIVVWATGERMTYGGNW